MGKNKHPVECSCQRTEREKQEALISRQKHSDLVRRLKAEGFSNPAMLNWTFENDNGRSPQMHHAHRYVEQWQTMRAENLGLLLWGGVGTGKSFLVGCIANALMEQEVPVRMTNFARILNELNRSFSGRNEVVDKLCRYLLLIIDDFGMERGTEYALEQIYNIVDSRYRSRKPLIVTTNLMLDELRHPQDTAHARIYDRCWKCAFLFPALGSASGRRTHRKNGTFKKFNRMNQKIFLKNPLDCQSSATRKWSCLLNNCHRTENNPTPSEYSTPTLDEWSAFATFLADVIEKYASVLEIDNAVSSTNNENQQDTVDAALAA